MKFYYYKKFTAKYDKKDASETKTIKKELIEVKDENEKISNSIKRN